MTNRALTTNDYLGWVLRPSIHLHPLRKEVISVATRIQALLLVLGAIVAAAFGGSTPWGP
jgi:hypothetical protein